MVLLRLELMLRLELRLEQVMLLAMVVQPVKGRGRHARTSRAPLCRSMRSCRRPTLCSLAPGNAARAHSRRTDKDEAKGVSRELTLRKLSDSFFVVEPRCCCLSECVRSNRPQREDRRCWGETLRRADEREREWR